MTDYQETIREATLLELSRLGIVQDVTIRMCGTSFVEVVLPLAAGSELQLSTLLSKLVPIGLYNIQVQRVQSETFVLELTFATY